MKMSVSMEQTGHRMAIFYPRLLIPAGNFKVVLLTPLHKETLYSGTERELGLNFANSSYVDNQSELF